MNVFAISAEKILALMTFFALGFFLSRRRILSEDAPYTLSKLLTTLFCPALTLNSMASSLDRGTVGANINLLMTGVVVIVTGIVITRLLSRWLSADDQELRSTLYYNLPESVKLSSIIISSPLCHSHACLQGYETEKTMVISSLPVHERSLSSRLAWEYSVGRGQSGAKHIQTP